MTSAIPPRPRSTLFGIVVLWVVFYASFTLFTPALLDDADSVHAEVAREMLLRHDYVTLYANGIRYLEKAPLLYWSMAASLKAFMLFGASSARALAVAARLPLALTVLLLAMLVEAFARRLFRSVHAGLYAALILLSSFGIFLFTRITIPDGMVCLFTTLALYAFWRTEELEVAMREDFRAQDARVREFSLLFATACALNVLTKGLIGVVFPVVIVVAYLLLTRGRKRAVQRLKGLHTVASLATFLVLAAPWHVLAGLANPTQGRPAPFAFVRDSTFPLWVGHWIVPLPSDGNVRGWYWFYFMNEHLLRYLNLRVPHDYDTAPLWLFWGLCFVWMMPWSAFGVHAAYRAMPWRSEFWRSQFRRHDFPLLDRGRFLLLTWAAFVLLFFSLSTRQEYYVLPALPALAILIAGWLRIEETSGRIAEKRRTAIRATIVLLTIGTLFCVAGAIVLFHSRTLSGDADLATLLTQNPGDYALSMGHFLDLTGPALALFRLPLILATVSLLLGPLISLILHMRRRPHTANLALAAGAFGFLLAAHLGLRTFAPVLTSAQLARAIAPQVHPEDLVAIHGEYESGSTLGFYLQRADIHILDGRSSNLWYGSFFPDAPKIFETRATLAAKWPGSQRIFLWQSLTDPPNQLPALPGPVYILVKSGGKEIVSNRPNR
jgi:4-amino-4-deoxy-L-arabinose transferase-like glycosyltransferase